MHCSDNCDDFERNKSFSLNPSSQFIKHKLLRMFLNEIYEIIQCHLVIIIFFFLIVIFQMAVLDLLSLTVSFVMFRAQETVH